MKAMLLWSRLPQKPDLNQACQALLGHSFLASLTKIPACLAKPGFSKLAGLLVQRGMVESWLHSKVVTRTVYCVACVHASTLSTYSEVDLEVLIMIITPVQSLRPL